MTNHKVRLAFSGFALLVSLCITANYQGQTVSPSTEAPRATLADVSWLAGHWTGPAFNGVCDEIWSPPNGNSMLGVFRLIKDGKAVFYELMVIVEENDSLVMKLKHFNADLSGWEEKEKSQSFPLVKWGPREAFFKGLTYRKLQDASLRISLTTKQKSGETVEQEFKLRSVANLDATEKKETSLIRTHALKINVDNMTTALDFYVSKLGFEIADRREYPQQVVLKTGDRVQLILSKVKRLQKAEPMDSRVGLTLQVNNLDEAIARLKSVGVEFAELEPRKEAVGNAIYVNDPFGRRISLMHQTIVKVDPFKEPRIYNFGVLVPEMEKARDFYANKLGFVVRSEKYLPLDLPLGHQDKSFGFMLHYRPGVHATRSEYPRASAYYTIVFETDDLQKAIESLKSGGVEIVSQEPETVSRRSAAHARPAKIVFKDPFGNISELWSLPKSP